MHGPDDRGDCRGHLSEGVHDVDVSEPGDSAILTSAFEVTGSGGDGSVDGDTATGTKSDCSCSTGTSPQSMVFVVGLLGLVGRRRR